MLFIRECSLGAGPNFSDGDRNRYRMCGVVWIRTTKQKTMSQDFIVPVAMFAMIFGCVYIGVTSKHRQRMALIEKGMDPKLLFEKYRSLRNGMLMAGIGVGLFFGYLMDRSMPQSGIDGDMGDTPLPYFIMTLLCGGAALIGHHFLVRNKQEG